MGCACNKRNRAKFVWTSADGQTSTTYNTEIEAKAKMIRKGGTYKRVAIGG